jgi:hypothetical protein
MNFISNLNKAENFKYIILIETNYHKLNFKFWLVNNILTLK